MSTAQTEVNRDIIDAHRHADSDLKKNAKNVAQQLDASVFLHTLYGLLDGISVS